VDAGASKGNTEDTQLQGFTVSYYTTDLLERGNAFSRIFPLYTKESGYVQGKTQVNGATGGKQKRLPPVVCKCGVAAKPQSTGFSLRPCGAGKNDKKYVILGRAQRRPRIQWIARSATPHSQNKRRAA
jgi:hypothetical protein